MRRRLKIAWTAFFAVLTVALCVLWVRSYWRLDQIGLGALGRVESCFGQLKMQPFDNAELFADVSNEWRWYSTSDVVPAGGVGELEPRVIAGLYLVTFRFVSIRYVVAPHWFLSVVFACFAAAPWLSSLLFLFSLRTMLIVTTLVAVVLGLVVWKARG